jgi:DNA (cytosine-5)-methyltransferase 1
MRSSHITVSDFFCGAGGSSQGVRRVAEKWNGGLEVKLAMNHWKLAIETHNTNFPETTHVCTDISACDPRRYYSTTIAVMSPECTTRSPAGGNNHKSEKKAMELFDNGIIKPETERSRATMWDVCRFAEYHNYEAIIVENVVEAKTSWPLFDSWLGAMHVLGYDHKCVYLNSMHCHPTPQSRDRMYVVFWKKGNTAPNLEYMPLAYSAALGKDVHAIQSWKNQHRKFGKYKQQYNYCCPVSGNIVEPYYYASANIIDWSDLGTRIGSRKKDIAPKSRARIQYGLDKYENDPFIFPTNYSDQARGIVKSVDSALGTQTTFSGSQAIVNPFIFKQSHSSQEKGYVYSGNEVIGAQTTRQDLGMIVRPYIVEMNRTGECKPATEPTATITSGGINHAVCSMPLIVENKGWSNSRGVKDALSTATTKEYHGLLTDGTMKSFLAAFHNGSHCTKNILEASNTFPTKDSLALINYKKPVIDDCYYRMLKPSEIKLGMAFDSDYIVLGSGKDQVKQLGNAVTPPAMEWLVQQVVESLS